MRDYILKWSDPSDNTWSSLEEIGDVEFAGASDSEKNISVTVNGVPVVITDCEPMIMNDRVMLPIRAVAEAAGLAVDWDEAKRTVGIRGVGETFEYPGNRGRRASGVCKRRTCGFHRSGAGDRK